MKKFKIATLAMAVCMSAVMLCACGSETVKKVAYELPYYDGTTRRDFDTQDKPYFNTELWRRNSSLKEGADVQILDDTARTGYYYAYSTGYKYYYSKDLANWNFGANFYDLEGLAGSDIDIEYLYSYAKSNSSKATILVKTDDLDKANKILKELKFI